MRSSKRQHRLLLVAAPISLGAAALPAQSQSPLSAQLQPALVASALPAPPFHVGERLQYAVRLSAVNLRAAACD